ncbi:MAG: hypothetical protein PHU04_02140 [Candidatus Peribacteraceae bacterium]|nr:hypothetical protein [Candidatus Peribacteraceae bacterium]
MKTEYVLYLCHIIRVMLYNFPMENFNSHEEGDAENLERRARQVLRNALRLAALDCLGDGRLPTLDTNGMMADAQIRPQHLAAIRTLVETEWPAVTLLQIRGSYGINDPHLECDICIHPFSRKGQRDHWALADQIDAIAGKEKLHYCFLPHLEPRPYSNTVEILRRDPPQKNMTDSAEMPR